MYFFRREKILCRYQFALRDAVESPFAAGTGQRRFRQVRLIIPSVWCRKSGRCGWSPTLSPALCTPAVHMRNIPEQTNGYLFCVSCEGDTVYFDWHHFLLDGHGVSPCSPAFWSSTATCVTAQPLRCTQIVCDPPYDMQTMLAEYPPVEYGSDVIQRDVVQTYEGSAAPHPGVPEQAEPCGPGSGEQRKAGKRPDGSAVHGHAGVSGQGRRSSIPTRQIPAGM